MDVSLKSSRLGKKVIEAHSISKGYKNKIVIDGFSSILQSGDRIAIVGPNGAGKTTLMKLFAKDLEPDSGSIEMGSTVRIAHFHQHLPKMEEGKRIIEYIRETSNDIEDATELEFRHPNVGTILVSVFSHGTPIGKLSGGERKRLYLLKLLMEQPNVLLLMNRRMILDIETLSVLESFIDSFPEWF